MDSITNDTHGLRSDVLHILDLIPMSVSSIAPAFSIAAAYGILVSLSGPQAIMSTFVTAVPLIFAALIFRQLNMHYPHVGASYHWTTKILGKRAGRFQGWIVSLAYFLSIPPIVVPAGEYTLQLASAIGLISAAAASNIFFVSITGICWVLIAIVPLVLGVKPTARFTEVFLAMELAVFALFFGFGISNMHGHVVNNFSFSWFFSTHISVSGLAMGMAIAITILDGWEINSYSSEESKNPKVWPGMGGIIGLLVVLVIYGVAMPLMTMETPLSALSQSTNPLATWASYVVPQYGWIIDLAVIASTASSLWLTTFILSRAWYAMARDGQMPRFMGILHSRFRSPFLSIWVIGMLSIGINLGMLAFPTVKSFFALLLGAAGIFLAIEFCIDCISGTAFFWFIHLRSQRRGRHAHWAYRLMSLVGAISLAAIAAIGVYYSPVLIGKEFPYVFAFLLVPGVVMALYKSRKHA
jgi:amino acid transporter